MIVEINGATFEITDPLQITFDGRKSIDGGLNTFTLNVFNLNEPKRLALIKDTEEVKYIPVQFEVGYQGQLLKVFRGDVRTAGTKRDGVNYITTLECYDGGYDYLESFTSRSVKSKKKAIDEILKDMPHTGRGAITDIGEQIRPKVMVGSSSKLVEEILKPDETFYIDEEKLYIIKDDEVVNEFIPVVAPSTGLINTPERDSKRVTFTSLMNPQIKIGGLVELRSTSAEHLNGIYKVRTISYKGDLEGDSWSQECTGFLAKGYKVVS